MRKNICSRVWVTWVVKLMLCTIITQKGSYWKLQCFSCKQIAWLDVYWRKTTLKYKVQEENWCCSAQWGHTDATVMLLVGPVVFFQFGFPVTFPVTWPARCNFSVFIKLHESCTNDCINYSPALAWCLSSVSFLFSTRLQPASLNGVERVGKRNIKKISSN